MFRILSKKEQEDAQRRGYMCEHLLCLYSIVANQTVLFNNEFPVFISGFGEADVVLFGFGGNEIKDKLKCVRELAELPINTINFISPTTFHELPNVRTKYTPRRDISTERRVWD